MTDINILNTEDIMENSKENLIIVNPLENFNDPASEIDITEILYKFGVDSHIRKEFEKLKRHSYILKEPPIDPSGSHTVILTKIHFDETENYKQKREEKGKKINRTILLKDTKLTELKPTFYDDQYNQLYFYIERRYNYISEYILPENMREGIDMVYLSFDDQDLIRIPGIMLRKNLPGDLKIPLPEILMTTHGDFRIIIQYVSKPNFVRERKEFEPNTLLYIKTGIVHKGYRFDSWISIHDFEYRKIPVSLEEDIVVDTDSQRIKCMFKKFTVIFEDLQGNFLPIKSIEIVLESWSKDRPNDNVIIWRSTKGLMGDENNKNNIYNCRMKKPFYAGGFSGSTIIKVHLHDGHPEGVLHAVFMEKNIICSMHKYCGKVISY